MFQNVAASKDKTSTLLVSSKGQTIRPARRFASQAGHGRARDCKSLKKLTAQPAGGTARGHRRGQQPGGSDQAAVAGVARDLESFYRRRCSLRRGCAVEDALDTNVLVRFFVDDPDDAQAAKQRPYALQALSQRCFVPITVVLELEWVLRGFYELGPKDVARVRRRRPSSTSR
jgi:hypothetical protein